jgi:hypothetical protein
VRLPADRAGLGAPPELILKAGRFGAVPGETEVIPLPDHPAPPVDYP